MRFAIKAAVAGLLLLATDVCCAPIEGITSTHSRSTFILTCPSEKLTSINTPIAVRALLETRGFKLAPNGALIGREAGSDSSLKTQDENIALRKRQDPPPPTNTTTLQLIYEILELILCILSKLFGGPSSSCSAFPPGSTLVNGTITVTADGSSSIVAGSEMLQLVDLMDQLSAALRAQLAGGATVGVAATGNAAGGAGGAGGAGAGGTGASGTGGGNGGTGGGTGGVNGINGLVPDVLDTAGNLLPDLASGGVGGLLDGAGTGLTNIGGDISDILTGGADSVSNGGVLGGVFGNTNGGGALDFTGVVPSLLNTVGAVPDNLADGGLPGVTSGLADGLDQTIDALGKTLTGNTPGGLVGGLFGDSSAGGAPTGGTGAISGLSGLLGLLGQ